MMRQLPVWIACILLAIACSASSAWGQRPRSTQTPPGRKPAAPRPAEPFRDPTQPSPEVREAIEATQVGPDGPGLAAPAPPVMPQVRLRARLVGSVGPPIAIIEIDGQLLRVYSDTETTVANKAGGATTLLVRKITAREVQIELPALKKLLVFH